MLLCTTPDDACNKPVGHTLEHVQGDTAETRRLRTEKYRRQAGLDGLPTWGVAEEARLTRLCKEASEGLCFAVVKQATAG